jgi:hypothetical protein
MNRMTGKMTLEQIKKWRATSGDPDNLLSGRAQRTGGRWKIPLEQGREVVGSPPVAFGHPDNKLSGPPKTSAASAGKSARRDSN